MTDTSIRGRFTFSLSCAKCGSNELTIPDVATDDSPVTCSGCGAEVARWGDVQAAIQKAAKEKFTKAVKDGIGKAIKGIDGVTFK